MRPYCACAGIVCDQGGAGQTNPASVRFQGGITGGALVVAPGANDQAPNTRVRHECVIGAEGNHHPTAGFQATDTRIVARSVVAAVQLSNARNSVVSPGRAIDTGRVYL